MSVATRKALFLRTYSRAVFLLPSDRPDAFPGECRVLTQAGVSFFAQPIVSLERAGDTILARSQTGERLVMDILYPALGCAVRSDLAAALGARRNAEGSLIVDEHQRTSVEGLYAAGDVVSDLNQISVAVGHAAIAATAIHNSLSPNYR
jgi:thioredoxin reductase (NADPH)